MPEFTPINGNSNMEHADVKSEGAKMEDILPETEEEGGDNNGAVKEETDEEYEESKANGTKGNGKKASPKSPATPRKRGRKPAAENGEEATADAAENEESPTKKKRASPKSKTTDNGDKVGKSNQRSLPTSYENASEADRMLLRMKDVEGRSWAAIREAWEAMTGDKVGGSTLSGRYIRIKANFTVFSKEDETRLIQFKKEIEEELEREKWTRLSDAIEKAGGSKYPPQSLQKKFKELSKKMSDVSIANGTEAVGA